MKSIDLRSDTTTRPSPAMRRAMAEAEVGDDFYGDDPTVRKLEERAAEILGKPAAMLVLSGTMGNLVSLLANTRRGDAILLADTSHIFMNEGGNLAAVPGLLPRTVSHPNGLHSEEQVRQAILAKSVLYAPLSLVCIENTHNAGGGRCLSAAETAAICAAAHKNDLLVHLDGARIFNAAIATRTTASALVESVDSVTFCLTKGLGCPVGSIVGGSADFVAQARRWRQVLGGGMRQAGIFAAAGLVALDSMVERLADDHRNARDLADCLLDLDFVLPFGATTNMVFAEPPPWIDPGGLVGRMREAGVLVNSPKGRRIRFVTHADISADDIAETARRLRGIVASLRPARRVG